MLSCVVIDVYREEGANGDCGGLPASRVCVARQQGAASGATPSSLQGTFGILITTALFNNRS